MAYRSLHNLVFTSHSDFPITVLLAHSGVFQTFQFLFQFNSLNLVFCLECPQIVVFFFFLHHSVLCTNVTSSERPSLAVLCKRISYSPLLLSHQSIAYLQHTYHTWQYLLSVSPLACQLIHWYMLSPSTWPMVLQNSLLNSKALQPNSIIFLHVSSYTILKILKYTYIPC